MPKIKVGTTEYYYQISGEGHPIVLISGYSVDNTFWLPVKEYLTQHFKVVTFDNRGSGQTIDDGGALSAELMAEDTIGLIKALGLKKPHIVGHSMGGNIALVIASKYSDLVGKVAPLETSSKWRSPVLISSQLFIDMLKDGSNLEQALKAKASWVFSAKFLSDPNNLEFFKKKYHENPNPVKPKDLVRQLAVLANFDGEMYLSSIKGETLIVYGDEDIIALPKESMHLADQIKGSQLVRYNGAHGIVQEDPRRVSQILIDFIRK